MSLMKLRMNLELVWEENGREDPKFAVWRSDGLGRRLNGQRPNIFEKEFEWSMYEWFA